MRKSVFLSCVASMAFLSMPVSTIPLSAQETVNTRSSGWYKACSDQGQNKICNVQYQALASTGQVITSVNMAQITGSISREVFQVTVPTGRLIPPGLSLTVDEQEPIKLEFSFCTPRICAAEAKLEQSLVDLFKAGKLVKFESINWQGKPNPLEISLEGFSAAFDGPPIKQDELDKRTKKLEEELKEKSDDLLKKLQDAQEKAREGTE